MIGFSSQIKTLCFIAALLILIELINVFTGRLLSQFGVIPRHLTHLPGIFAAPFLHGTPAHLMANLFPLLLFMWLSMQWGKRTFIITTFAIIILSGLAVWLFARGAIHIGASGLVYGYFGFLVLAGFRSKKIRYLVISVIVAIVYGGMLVGILPLSPYISFEYHLFGFISGLVAAWYWAK
ncbi:rhomboid family intramembrane serine protease [Alteromonas sp. KUL49]|nr:rhomboid family intramembrane serine protease [Alteromonas sp. KUL49]TAP39780.1 rhomboid family intramembrane serine protease [Alteromonas sp. KUL49]